MHCVLDLYSLYTGGYKDLLLAKVTVGEHLVDYGQGYASAILHASQFWCGDNFLKLVGALFVICHDIIDAKTAEL